MDIDHDFAGPENRVICPSLPRGCRMVFAGDVSSLKMDHCTSHGWSQGPLPACHYLRAQPVTLFSFRRASYSQARAIM